LEGIALKQWQALLIVCVLLAGGSSVRAQGVHCTPQRPVANRASPYDSTWIEVGGKRALLCYSRPSARGRTMIGGENVPFGKLWRTGANEPTTLHLPFTAEIGGVSLEPGSYSIYTVPDPDEWEFILNRSTSQWGTNIEYTPQIQKQEAGRARVKPEKLDAHVEMFTITNKRTGAKSSDLILDWERTRIRVPVVLK
jgi:hypothetical protein